MPKVYFKLNNHQHPPQVAYYHHQTPHGYLTWQARSNFAGLGEELFLFTNEFGRNSTSQNNPHGHFGAPQEEDLVVIFQRVFKKTRVVTHVLKYLDHDVHRDQLFSEWPHHRRTQIVAVLNPAEFAGQVINLPDLIATKNPSSAFVLQDFTQGTSVIFNGRVYLSYADHEPISYEHLQMALAQSPAYDCMSEWSSY